MNQWPEDPAAGPGIPPEPAPPEPSEPEPVAVAAGAVPEDATTPGAEAPTIFSSPQPPPELPTATGNLPSPPPLYADRSTGLTVFGVILLLLGFLSLLIVPFILFSAVMTRKTMGGTLPARNYVLAIMNCIFLTATCITLGVGSIRARRWAWALTLISSWFWLILGFVMTIMITAVMPASFMAGVRAGGSAAGPMPKGVIAVILTFVIVFFAVFFVGLPAAFLIFYRRKDVQETCRRRDPHESWTERIPLPVLAASLIFAYGTVSSFLMSFTTPLVPFFGSWITGWRGGIACLALAGIELFVSLSLYRLKVAGWWVAIATLVVRLCSSTLTFLRGDLLEAYARMGMPARRLQMMRANPVMGRGGMVAMGSIFIGILLIYMIWIKRYFKPSIQPVVF